MDDERWQLLFDIINDVVNLPHVTWQEKRQEVVDKCNEFASSPANFEEFIGWFDGEVND